MRLATLFLVTCKLCLAIRVPIVWDASASEVKHPTTIDNDEQFSVESFKPENVQQTNVDSRNKPIPVEYFQYTAKKPQFAVNIAKFHGMRSPENHYKAYPIDPHTGIDKPKFGKHQLLDKGNVIHRHLQEFANINEDVVAHAVPVASNYEVFHPYEAETPALQEIYKDPTLTKIRSDLENSKNRLQTYEKEAGEPHIYKNEYLETPHKVENRFFPHRNVPAPYEIHRPQKKPIYYRPVQKNPYREQYLNQKLKHPWNQYSAKIRPVHYRPIKNHIHHLRQNHALKYDDARNEYPQVQILESISSDPKDGYDIYEKGKKKFLRLRDNVDESINKAVKENRPSAYEKLEMQSIENVKEEDEDDFVPIKNYAQVRKSETYKHLPKSSAFEDAENFDEIKNAPRLREAVKSTKAQTIYSEEGYEDTGYDHAGEQKHASENEGHGGYLKEHELSSGKYKAPSESAKYEEEKGSAFRDQTVHAEKWNDDNDNNKEEAHEENYNENEQEDFIEADEVGKGIFNSAQHEEESYRRKREDKQKNNTELNLLNSTTSNDVTSHDIDKQYVKFEIPQVYLNSTFLTENEILELAKIRIQPKKDAVRLKYPYYFKNIHTINKHSPLRYSENLKHIPKKSKGGTEFYDSRSQFECPEVDELPDPIPDKLKGEGHPDENDNNDEGNQSKQGDENYNTAKQTPRLTGLGDKIDCFKAKYFGENPLDSPFFKEDIILDPEPVTIPNIAAFKLIKPNHDDKKSETNSNKPAIIDVSNNLRYEQKQFKNSLPYPSADLRSISENINSSNINILHLIQPQNVYSNILNNIKMNTDNIDIFAKYRSNLQNNQLNLTESPTNDNITYHYFKNIEDITQLPSIHRQKRSSSFVYEPYKIIRDSQIQDSKKTTTTSNISPLIRRLQSSRIVDKAQKRTQELDKSENPVKRNVNSRNYKDIGRKDTVFNESVVDLTSVDTSSNTKRGEPMYEIRHANHKVRYTPVENKKSLAFGDYTAQKSFDKNVKDRGGSNISDLPRQKVSTARSLANKVAQNVAASSNNTTHNRISTTTAKPQKTKTEEFNKNDESVENYEEYDDKEEGIITTTTTTLKPSFRRRIRTTTEKIIQNTEKPKLKLAPQFRHYDLEKNNNMLETQDTPKSRTEAINKVKNGHADDSAPKYREKKKKSTKSTLVTDTKKYGDDDHDMQKEEVDALIGVKHDMSDYMPSYEKEEEEKLRKAQLNKDESDEVNDDESDESDEDSDCDIDDSDDEDYDEIDENEDNIEDDGEEESSELEPQVTTSEPTKRTLAVTTDAPTPTIASQYIKPEDIPTVVKKEIEIHKELPANKSSAHVTQFKQDIKEIEVVKELPVVNKQKPLKNLEVLELYRDDNLAKDINKLGGVEVFKKDIDLKNGPKHGGNYRSLEEPSAPTSLRQARRRNIKEDAETSQSEFKKHIELEDGVSRGIQMHGGNLRSLNDNHKIRSRGRSSKLRELSEPPVTSMYGGNLKHRGRGHSGRSQKLIELDDYDQKEDDPSSDHESFSNSDDSRPLHGGNYRSEQLVATEKPDVSATSAKKVQNARKTSADILNSFVQAAPILTTTPAFILDPSKRMYYYVDA